MLDSSLFTSNRTGSVRISAPINSRTSTRARCDARLSVKIIGLFNLQRQLTIASHQLRELDGVNLELKEQLDVTKIQLVEKANEVNNVIVAKDRFALENNRFVPDNEAEIELLGYKDITRCHIDERIPTRPNLSSAGTSSDTDNSEKHVEASAMQKLKQLDAKLAIVSQESRELQEKVVDKERCIEQKVAKMGEMVGVIEHLRRSSVKTAECLERAEVKLHSRASRMQESMACQQRLEAKAAHKDYLLRTLVDAVVASQTNQNFFSALVRKLWLTTAKPSYFKSSGRMLDFNLDSLCSYIETEGRRHRRLNEEQATRQVPNRFSKEGLTCSTTS